MRHGFAGRRFNRSASHRKAMLANLAASLIKHEQIVTTLPKAKDLRPVVERLVTLGKKQSLASRRLLEAQVGPRAAKKIATDLAKTYETRAGGYTRIVKAGIRASDAAPIAIIELVDRDVDAKGQDSGPAMNEDMLEEA